MPVFSYQADWQTSARAGAGGMFQIASLSMDGKDVTNCIDQGLHFHEEDFDSLVEYLATTFNISASEVKFEQSDQDDWPYK